MVICAQLVWYFGISWVMPKRVVELLAWWHRGVGQHRAASFWGSIPQCIMWTIWSEQNNRTSEGEEHSIIELKRIFILYLFE